jgi:hypothetical protein
MEFVIQSPGGGALPHRAMRRLVEVVDACRGQGEVFVVYRDKFPYPAISVHLTARDAQKAIAAEAGLSYFGPVTPEDAPSTFNPVLKTTGTSFKPLSRPVSRVVLLDDNDAELARFSVNPGGLTNPQTDIEALFLTPSSVDKYAIPYVSRVYGAEYAAERRREWIKD